MLEKDVTWDTQKLRVIQSHGINKEDGEAKGPKKEPSGGERNP